MVGMLESRPADSWHHLCEADHCRQGGLQGRRALPRLYRHPFSSAEPFLRVHRGSYTLISAARQHSSPMQLDHRA